MATEIPILAQSPPTVEPIPGGLRVRFGASLENIDAVDAAVTQFLCDARLPVDRFALRILLREALLNGVTHGSGQDPLREVRLELLSDADGVLLTVEDDGPGFEWQRSNASFDTFGDGGRGLALMRLYSSQMTFNPRGNRVTLRRPYDAPPPPAQG
jgi:serine/threonine-protein kinase RsbW